MSGSIRQLFGIRQRRRAGQSRMPLVRPVHQATAGVSGRPAHRAPGFRSSILQTHRLQNAFSSCGESEGFVSGFQSFRTYFHFKDT